MRANPFSSAAVLLTAGLLAPAVALGQTTTPAGANKPSADTRLTLYNQGPAAVWQMRDLSLENGSQTIAWPDAPQLLPESLWLAGEGVTLQSATVNGAANASPAAMLARRVGQSVTLLPVAGGEPREATLVSAAGSTAVVRVEDRFELVGENSAWRIVWPAENDTGLRLRVQADSAGRQPVTLTYQRGGINWHASYSGHYDAQEDKLTLQSLAAVENSSGGPVRADSLALIAGDVARTGGQRPPRPMMMARAEAADSAAAPQQAGSYYRYTLDAPLDLASGSTQVIALMDAQTFDVEREYRIENPWYGRDAGTQRDHAEIRLSFDNGSGLPLPAGSARIYGGGSSSAILLGEDRIGNTPDGAPVTLTLGQAFDITAERRVVESSQEGNEHRQTVEVTLRNARSKAATVTVVENLPNGAKIVSESAEHASKTAREATWKVNVPGEGEATLTYTVAWTA